MTPIDRTPGSPPDVDTLLRVTLPDDLPPDLEARLENRVERFLADRRRGTARTSRLLSLRVLTVAASAVLVVCGVALDAVGRPGVVAASMLRVNEAVTLWDTVRRAASMKCTGVAGDDFRSPADLADRVYRDWVLVDSAVVPAEAATVLTLQSPGERAQYELVVDPGTKLPRRIVKTWLSGARPPHRPAKGYDASCTWEMPAPDDELSAATASRTGR